MEQIQDEKYLNLIKQGDIFLVNSNNIMSPLTNFFQKLWSKDNKSTYVHCGIIIDNEGTTFEASWTVRSKNIFLSCRNREVLIARCINLTVEEFDKGMKEVLKYKGCWYPIHRLILHALRLAKFIHWRSVVCSELVSKYLFGVGIRDNYWFGTTVDDLEEELTHWKDYEIVFKGKF